MPEDRRFIKRMLGGIYSAAAEKVYDRVVVRGSFRLLGGELNDLVLAQGRDAAAAAGGGPILDMPVGTAYFTVPMARDHEGLVVGVDIAEGMVVKALHTARDSGIHNLATVRADAHHLPFADSSFAGVGSWNGLPVMPGLHTIVAELTRVLAPGGRMFVSAITVPFGKLLPRRSAEHLPTMMRSGDDVVESLRRAGLVIVSERKARLARLIEASKPAATHSLEEKEPYRACRKMTP